MYVHETSAHVLNFMRFAGVIVRFFWRENKPQHAFISKLGNVLGLPWKKNEMRLVFSCTVWLKNEMRLVFHSNRGVQESIWDYRC